MCSRSKINKISKVNHGNDDQDTQHIWNKVIYFVHMVCPLLRQYRKGYDNQRCGGH